MLDNFMNAGTVLSGLLVAAMLVLLMVSILMNLGSASRKSFRKAEPVIHNFKVIGKTGAKRVMPSLLAVIIFLLGLWGLIALVKFFWSIS